ncbi:hypothetical protein AB1Y20_011306 [Prymnesium parvum]|uniref:EF-hand domain-containing protein n=1 Tax=Prymnesium parvum TaxID=97485 RepID=A0AB34IMU6_PRYPA
MLPRANVGRGTLPFSYGADVPRGSGFRSGRSGGTVLWTKEMLDAQQEKLLMGRRPRKTKVVRSRFLALNEDSTNPHALLRGKMDSIGHSFADADADGDAMLDIDEFEALLSSPLGSGVLAARGVRAPDVRTWFADADLNGDGKLSLAEVFAFVLQSALEVGAEAEAEAEAEGGEGRGMSRLHEWGQRVGGVLDRRAFLKLTQRLASAEGIESHLLLDAIDPHGKGEVHFAALQALVWQCLTPPYTSPADASSEEDTMVERLRPIVLMLNRKCYHEDHAQLVKTHIFSEAETRLAVGSETPAFSQFRTSLERHARGLVRCLTQNFTEDAMIDELRTVLTECDLHAKLASIRHLINVIKTERGSPPQHGEAPMIMCSELCEWLQQHKKPKSFLSVEEHTDRTVENASLFMALRIVLMLSRHRVLSASISAPSAMDEGGEASPEKEKPGGEVAAEPHSPSSPARQFPSSGQRRGRVDLPPEVIDYIVRAMDAADSQGRSRPSTVSAVASAPPLPYPSTRPLTSQSGRSRGGTPSSASLGVVRGITPPHFQPPILGFGIAGRPRPRMEVVKHLYRLPPYSKSAGKLQTRQTDWQP